MIHLHGTQAVALRVLIVDRDPIQRVIIARCVEMLGWDADLAADLGQAIDLFSARRHSVVVVDLGIGVADGNSLLHHLRRGHGDPTLILVAAKSDHSRIEMLQATRDLGLRVAGTLTRPVDPYRLHALLLSNPSRPRAEHRRAVRCPTARELDRALRDNEIQTDFQPKIDLITGAIVGIEALARWRDPRVGDIPPEQFVAVAEQSELIGPLTFRVLEVALAACRRWRDIQPDCAVAVNFSAGVLADPGLSTMIDKLLCQARLPPGALIAEVSESTLMANLPRATEVLTRLSMNGVRVSMDGFGIGSSSLSSLLRMPFAELKIDRSFIAVCRSDAEAWRLVQATVSLGRAVGMNVVAEGIETEEISDRLRDIGCDLGQGWYFSRPMGGDAMLRSLSDAAHARSDAEAAEPLALVE